MRPVIGLLFGLVNSRGRASGQTRRNLVTYRRADGRTFLLGLYGRESHWYRNLTDDPQLTFQDAFSTRPMLAVPLTDDAALLDAYSLLRRRSPIVFRSFYLWALGIRDDAADLRAKRDRVTVVELRDASDAAAPDARAGHAFPPPVRVDLLWVWPLIVALAWIVRRARR